MNISLAPKKKAKVGYGLNKRGSNVFGGSDDDDDEEEPLSERDRVNQQIVKEQAALRKRAQAAAAAAVEDPSVYDYDGVYDSFKAPAAAPKKKEERKSKYIGDLLKSADKRNQEKEAIHERKVAREQAEEDAKEEYQGKEKFVTKAYKRKLEERKRFEAEEEVRQREEDANDVTKKTGGAAFASFYGNFNRNVAMGGKEEDNGRDKDKAKGDENAVGDADDDFKPSKGGMGFLAGFERSEGAVDPELQDNSQDTPADSKAKEPEEVGEAPQESKFSMRELREKKVAEARIRYIERKQMVLQ
jgi:coiled-coil domain-containing protein 55